MKARCSIFIFIILLSLSIVNSQNLCDTNLKPRVVVNGSDIFFDFQGNGNYVNSSENINLYLNCQPVFFLTKTNVYLEGKAGEEVNTSFFINTTKPTNVNYHFTSPFIDYQIQGNTNLLSPYEPVYLKIKIPNDAIEGLYKSRLYIYGEGLQILNIDVFVNKTTFLDFTNYQNVSIPINSNGTFYVLIKNKSNYKINVTGNSSNSFIKIKPVVAYPNSDFALPIDFSTRKDVFQGVVNITLYDSNNIIGVLNINVSIKDDEKPLIRYVKIESNQKGGKSYDVVVDVIDNVGIKNVFAGYEYELEEFKLTYSDNYKMYFGTVIPKKSGDLAFVIKAQDLNDNNSTYTTRVNIEKLGGVDTFSRNIPQIKVGEEFKYLIIKSEYPTSVNLTLTDLQIQPENTSIKFYVYVGGNKIELEKDKAVNIPSFDELYLGVYSNGYSAFSAKLRADFLDYISESKEIDISSTFKDVTILPDFNVSVGDRIMNCVYKAGSIDEQNGYYCNIFYPYYIDSKRIGVYLSQEEYDLIVSNANKDVMLERSKVQARTILMFIFLGLFLITIFYLIYVKYIKGVVKVRV